MALRVLHLVGSARSEPLADLSRLYARDCLATVQDPARYEPVIAQVSPDGRWRFPAALDDEALAGAEPMSTPDAIDQLVAHDVDLALPQMFCLPGMTTYRSLLDLLGIPYVGNSPEAMALGADKARAKAVVAAADVAVATGVVVAPGSVPRARALGLPVVVKPVDGDNSDGVTLVTDERELPAAVAEACVHGRAALVERYVALGREVRCGVLERGGELITLPLEEYAVDENTKPIRDRSDKLDVDEAGELRLVAKGASRAWIVDPEDPISATVGAAARACHRALGCRHYSLFDFRVDPQGRPVFLEAGLYCSFARQSVVTTMAAAAGIDPAALFAAAVAEALTDPT